MKQVQKSMSYFNSHWCSFGNTKKCKLLFKMVSYFQVCHVQNGKAVFWSSCWSAIREKLRLVCNSGEAQGQGDWGAHQVALTSSSQQVRAGHHHGEVQANKDRVPWWVANLILLVHKVVSGNDQTKVAVAFVWTKKKFKQNKKRDYLGELQTWFYLSIR